MMRPFDEIDDPTWSDVFEREAALLLLREENLQLMKDLKALIDGMSAMLQAANTPELRAVVDRLAGYDRTS